MAGTSDGCLAPHDCCGCQHSAIALGEEGEEEVEVEVEEVVVVVVEVVLLLVLLLLLLLPLLVLPRHPTPLASTAAVMVVLFRSCWLTHTSSQHSRALRGMGRIVYASLCFFPV